MNIQKNITYAINHEMLSQEGVADLLALLEMNSTAAEGWEMIQAGHSYHEILEHQLSKNPSQRHELESLLTNLFQGVLQHKIIH